MDLVQENNPLETYSSTSKIIPCTFKNYPGRPINSKIIKFSQQPKSVVATILEEQKCLDSCTNKSGPCSNKETGQYNQELKLKKTSKINADKRLKIFSCTYENCRYATKISSNLTKHKRTHTNDKLYLCDKCAFSTKFSNSLNVHKRLHSNEKTKFCQYCQYKCNSTSNLKKHQNHKHSEKR